MCLSVACCVSHLPHLAHLGGVDSACSRWKCDVAIGLLPLSFNLAFGRLCNTQIRQIAILGIAHVGYKYHTADSDMSSLILLVQSRAPAHQYGLGTYRASLRSH